MSFIRFGQRRSARARTLTRDEYRFVRGARSIVDLVAPASVEVSRDHLRLDSQFVRTLVVTGYPRTVGPGWLSPLIDFEQPLEISLHVYPLETPQMVSTLSLENANMVIFATSGAGKSFFCKLTALRNLLLDVDFLVIDPEDEYRAVCSAVGGQYVRLASSSEQHLNPFDLPAANDEAEEDRDPLAEQVTGLLGLLEIMLAEPRHGLNMKERAVLDRALYQTYVAAGITEDTSTHTRPVPLLRDLHETLQDSPGEVAASLAERLRRYVQGSLAGLFSAPTNVALDRRFVVFNVQALEPELRPLGIHLITSFVWNQVRRSHRPRLLIIDEAWSLMQYPEGGAFLAGMSRRARKYYLGLVTITQDVGDFLGVDHGRTVLANAALKLLMKQDAAIIDPVVAAFQLSSEERQFLLAAGRGEGLFFARGSHVALKVEASPVEHRLATTAPREVAARAGRANGNGAATGERTGPRRRLLSEEDGA